MNLMKGSIEEAKDALAKHGLRMFEIVSYFLERKYNIIKEEHLLLKGLKAKTLEEAMQYYIEEIEHYGVERLVLSEHFLWKEAEFFKGYSFDFPLGEINNSGEVVQSDLWAKFSIEKDNVKLRMFDVP